MSFSRRYVPSIAAHNTPLWIPRLRRTGLYSKCGLRPILLSQSRKGLGGSTERDILDLAGKLTTSATTPVQAIHRAWVNE